jgi:hypothetical protein
MRKAVEAFFERQILDDSERSERVAPDSVRRGTDMRIGIRERIAPGAVFVLSILLSSAPAAPTFQAYVEDAATRDAHTSTSLILSLNDRYPYQNDVADPLYCDVDGFAHVGMIRDDDVRTGIIVAQDQGWERTFTVSVTGLSWAHSDLGGHVDWESGDDSAEIDPNSHDTTCLDEPTLEFMPGPGSLLVAALGVVLIGWVRLRRAL